MVPSVVRTGCAADADPNGTSPADEALRAVAYDDARILASTAYVAMRIAFSTVKDALGVQPEPELTELAPTAVRAAVTCGRPASAG